MKRSIQAACFVLLACGLGALGADVKYPSPPKNTSPLESMRTGKTSVAADPRNGDVLKEEAIWLAHRLAFPPYNGREPMTKTTDDIESLMEEVNRRISWQNPRTVPNAMQLEFAQAFGKALAEEILYVYDNTDDRLVRINAARMLATIGRLPYAALADQYLKMIRDNAYPMEVKRYAFEGLRNLLAVPDATYPNQHFIKSNPKLAEIAKELEKYINFKCAPNLPPDQAKVIQFIRREAVRALAQFKVAVVRQQDEALAKPIMTLLRVATNDQYTPPAEHALPGYGFDPLERVDAVIGICSMAPDKGLNLDTVVWLVNDAMINLSDFQGKERADFQKDPRNKPLVPWRWTGARLGDALIAWKKSVGTSPPRQNPKAVVDWIDVATKIVAKLETEGVIAQPDTRPFDAWKKDMARKPKSNEVIADDATTKIDIK
jgi:hypothetical protein